MDQLKEEYEQVKEALSEIENAHYVFEERFNALEEEYDEEVRARFNTWYQDQFQPFHGNLYSAMHAVESDLTEKMPAIEAYEMPEAEEVPLDDDCLYDSTREYIPQLAVYKQFTGKFSNLTEDEDDEDEEASA